MQKQAPKTKQDFPWQLLKNMEEKILYLYKNKHMYDVTFIVGENGEEISAHKLILAAHSPVFETMFYDSSSPKNDRIKLPNIEPHIFHLLLAYIYDKGSLETMTEAISLYRVADKYNLEKIRNNAESYITSNLSVENSLNVFEFAKSHNKEHLMKHSLKHWRENTGEVLSFDSFMDISISTIEELFKLNELNIESEMELVEAFGRYFVNHENGTLKGYDVWQILSKIRLLSIDPKKIVECKVFKSLLSESDYCKLLENIISTNLGKIPKHICCNRLKRGAKYYEFTITDDLTEKNKYESECQYIRACIMFYDNCQIVGFTLEPFCKIDQLSILFEDSNHLECFKTDNTSYEIKIKLKTPVFIERLQWKTITLKCNEKKILMASRMKSKYSVSENGIFVFSGPNCTAFKTIQYLL